MEEKQIRDFVLSVSSDEQLRQALKNDPNGVIERAGLSPRVAKIVMRLVPQLTLGQEFEPSLSFWH
jgi:hypothetical protein